MNASSLPHQTHLGFEFLKRLILVNVVPVIYKHVQTLKLN